MALAAVTLDDKYELEVGRVFLTGTQALVRLPMMQRQRDLKAGLNTASFVSGYRGSPLGGLDQAFWQAKRFLAKNHIHFQPGINEDLAATAVWGSQQVGLFPGAKYDGVNAMWYGKGPGVDRSGDVLKHGNFAGSGKHGGVLLLAGDDHAAKSSTLPHQSEYAFMSAIENFYTPLGKSMIAALTGAAPEVVFIPCNPKEIDDINAAKEAQKYKKVFYYNANMDQVLKDMARYFWTDGRTVLRAKQVTDAKFGYNPDGTPKTQEIVECGGVLEWKVPITAHNQSEFHYASYSHEISVAQAKNDWPDKADKIKPGMSGPASDQFDRLCRLATLQGTDSMYAGDTYAHVVTICEVWIRPCAFMLVPKGVREEFQQKYPRGVRVTFAGNEFVEAVEESMDDVIEVILPQPGDGQAVASLGEFVIPIQKMHNNKKNLSQEAWEKGTPLKFVDSKAVAEEGMADQLASPEVYMPIKNPYPSQPLGNCFYKEQQPTQSPDMMASLKDDVVNAQMISSVQPALFGGSMVNAKTAAVYSQARDQALGASVYHLWPDEVRSRWNHREGSPSR